MSAGKRKPSLYERVFKGKELKAEELQRSYLSFLDDIAQVANRFSALVPGDASLTLQEKEFLKKRVADARVLVKNGVGMAALEQIDRITENDFHVHRGVPIAKVIAAFLHIYEFLYGKTKKSSTARRASEKAREQEEHTRYLTEFPGIVDSIADLKDILDPADTGSKRGKVKELENPKALLKKKLQEIDPNLLRSYENARENYHLDEAEF